MAFPSNNPGIIDETLAFERWHRDGIDVQQDGRTDGTTIAQSSNKLWIQCLCPYCGSWSQAYHKNKGFRRS